MSLEQRLKRPGFGLPLQQMPEWHRDGNKERFPHAIADFFATSGITVRELRMLDFMNQITDKPRWWVKMNDGEIVARWRNEACGSEEQQRHSGDHLDKGCFDYLRDKASYLEHQGLIHVLDVNATIVKSDLDTSDPFWTSLREHVRSLENVPDRLKDWHPGSDGLVLDLLHPSLYPLQYGKSRVLPTGSVPLRNCVEHTGLGEVCLVPSFSINETHSGYYKRKANGNEFHLDAWGYYQWLPSEISFGEDGSAKVDSYINNLHPERHAELHDVLATAVDKAVPLWNECLSWFHERLRLPVAGCSYEDFVAPTYPGYSHEDNDDNDDEDMDGEHESIDEYDKEQHYRDWMQAHPEERLLKQPSPHGDYVPFEQRLQTNGSRRIDLRSGFRDGLQVIFKLANIHLTPEKPVYSGSNWHVEGALNEHICATALFYYDSDNITDSYLEFRQEVDSMDMTCKPSQYEWEAAEAMFGIQNEGSAIQGLGRVLTRPGRLLAFPNVLQHKVGQFGLKDATKAGHRKILAMFLVDPHIQILSTANVPPQRVDWWAVEVQKVPPFSDLPVELFDRIMEHVEDFPISWDEACEMREELMAERGRANEDLDEMLREGTFYYCEH